MVNGLTVAVLAVFSFVAIIQPGMGLKCWSCSSDMHPECENIIHTERNEKIFATDCNDQDQQGHAYGDMICKKIIKKLHGDPVVIRKCEIPSPEETRDGVCHVTPSSFTTIVSCNVCNTDLCNAAPAATKITTQLIYFCSIALLILSFSPAGGATLFSYLPVLPSF